MTEEERLLVQREIAGFLDLPSVYMGGASKSSMRKAGAIIELLERSKRLVPSTCDHSAWLDYKIHGACCPDCGTDLRNRAQI